MSAECQILYTSGRGDNPVGRVAVETFRKECGFNGDSWRNLQQSYACLRKKLLKPCVQRYGERNTLAAVQICDLEKRDTRNIQVKIDRGVIQLPFL